MINSIDIILVLILLSVLLSLSSSRMMALVKTMSFQGAMVSLVPLLIEYRAGLSGSSVSLTSLMLLIKGIIIPSALSMAVTKVAIKREVEPIIGYHASLAAALGFILLAVHLADKLELSLPNGNSLVLITAFTTLAGGLFLMMSRTKAITQVIGYLMLENGIFLVGSTLAKQTHHLYIIEFGILLDLLAGVMIMGIVLHNINRTFDDVDTSHLEQLKD